MINLKCAFSTAQVLLTNYKQDKFNSKTNLSENGDIGYRAEDYTQLLWSPNLYQPQLELIPQVCLPLKIHSDNQVWLMLN